jgi:predicted DNA-binding protein (MmcQ/YjbR family)
MDILELRRYCLSLPLAEECTPFDETTLVFKIGGKMFCYTDMVEFRWIAVKCDPDRAVLLRERYPELVTPAFHSNKRHWNDLYVDRDLSDAFVREQIRRSYMLVLRHNVTPRTLRDEMLAHVARHGLPE